ncbi:MAG TPA: heme o synthase [Thermoanaerobaculia bacterium]|nr:heme o synthase [Thermoanaerobaculia bacterium]
MTHATSLPRTHSPGAVVRDYLELSKARIVLMVLLTAAAGFAIASRGPVDWLLFAHLMIGTALIAGGTNALNQFAERDLDARMNRTRHRPLPDGRITPRAALTFSVTISVLGALYLASLVNPLTSILGALTLGSYLFIYTPLKQKTNLSTIVGAVPGAIPPMMGWAAATGRIEFGAWVMFAILFLWQLPHFLAIGWLYREDYERAGFSILSVTDRSGRVSGQQALLWSLVLVPISLLPVLDVIPGPLYAAGAVAAGSLLVVTSFGFARVPTMRTARHLFLASIVYLPLIMSLLVVTSRSQ